MSTTAHSTWETYVREELARLTPILARLGITLEDEQPHLGGERYLMQAVTTASGKKLILLARTKEGTRVVIKATRDIKGMEELRREREFRSLLPTIRFAYHVFFSPDEYYFGMEDGFLISAQVYIEQDMPFLSRSLREQFLLALSSFKAQEGVHATTYEHVQRIRNSFQNLHTHDYLSLFASFISRIEASGEDVSLLRKAEAFLVAHAKTIEQYSGFLTHSDFVPHNIRVVGETIYLLDHSSLRFGNKYDGWARFVNFMALHNPQLSDALESYVRLNRAPEEVEAARLMRIFKLGEILLYYADTLQKSEGDLHTLNRARFSFWSRMLSCVFENKPLPHEEVAAYITLRDTLRSPSEKKRQENLL